MDDEEDVVDHRHGVGAPDVEEIDDNNDGEDEKGALPVGRAIAGVVDHQDALDDCANEKWSGGLAGLPR